VPGPGVDALASSAVSCLASSATPSPSQGKGSATDGISRLLAARLLECNLVRIGRAGTTVDRRLATRLDRLRSRCLYRPLGFVRLGDFLTERLGMSLRRCQAILRLERAIRTLPAIARALEAGELSFSRVEAISGVATAATEELWLERARRLPVGPLRQAVREARARRQPEGTGAGSPAAPGADHGETPMTGEAIDRDEPGRLVSFAAPASVVGVWHWTLDLVRRVAGHQEPAWRCVEYLAAEFLSGVLLQGRGGHIPGAPPERDDASADVARGTPSPGEASDPNARTAGDLSDASTWDLACEAVREALASIGGDAGLEAIMMGERARGDADEEDDAWALDASLRRLVRLRQSLAWRQGRLLGAFASLSLHADLGFATLDDWIEDRLAMSTRRARYLVSLDRRLRRLPLVADAYRRGLITWCQARLVVRVTTPATQERWIRYARRVTVRRLEEAVIARDVESSGPAHIGASPLPPSEPSPSESQDDRAFAGSGAQHTSASLLKGASATAQDVRRPGRRISFWAPLDVSALWDSALSA